MGVRAPFSVISASEQVRRLNETSQERAMLGTLTTCPVNFLRSVRSKKPVAPTVMQWTHQRRAAGSPEMMRVKMATFVCSKKFRGILFDYDNRRTRGVLWCLIFVNFQNGSCFLSPFWHLELWGGCWVFGFSPVVNHWSYACHVCHRL